MLENLISWKQQFLCNYYKSVQNYYFYLYTNTSTLLLRMMWQLFCISASKWCEFSSLQGFLFLFAIGLSFREY